MSWLLYLYLAQQLSLKDLDKTFLISYSDKSIYDMLIISTKNAKLRGRTNNLDDKIGIPKCHDRQELGLMLAITKQIEVLKCFSFRYQKAIR